MKNIILAVTLFLMSLTGYTQPAPEQQTTASNITGSSDLPDVFYTATMLNPGPLNYPQNELNALNEGWVVVSFVISAEGKVIDPIILDSSSKSFEQAALRSLQRTTYTPARLNGENVEQCSNQYKMRFVLEDNEGVTPQFRYNYKRMVESFQKNDLEKVREYLALLENKSNKNHYQHAWLSWAKYLYAVKIKDEEMIFDNLLKAVAYIDIEDPLLPEREYATALAELFIAYMSRLELALAMEQLEKLKNSKGAEKHLAYLAPYITKVEEAANSSQPLLIRGRTEAEKIWRHTLYRDSFKIDNITGTLDKYEIRCHKKRIMNKVVAGEKINLPDDAGECMVILHGENDISFEFYEI